MAAFGQEDDQHWLTVIGRSLAFLSLHAADMRDREIGEQAAFLSALGLSRQEIAPLIGSTPASIEVLLRNRRKAGKQKGNGIKKKRQDKR